MFGVGVLDLRGQIAAVRQANTMLDNTAFGTLNPTALFLVCGWLVQSLPALLNLGIVHGLLQLVKLAKADRFAPGMAQAAAHCGTRPAELRRWMLQYKQCFWQYSFAPPGSCTS